MNETGKSGAHDAASPHDPHIAPHASSLADANASASTDGPEPFNEIENLVTENAALKDKVLRTLAEMENLRRRTEREVSDARAYGVQKFAAEMLAISDNLHRGLASLSAETRAGLDDTMKGFVEGVELSERDFQSRMARFNIKKIEPLGEKFDPNKHEALFEMPDESVPAGTVVQVVETGYSIADRVLRPAKVGVSKGGARA